MTGLRVLEMAGELDCASFLNGILDDLLSTCHFVALFAPPSHKPSCTDLHPSSVPASAAGPIDVMLHIEVLRNISVPPSTQSVFVFIFLLFVDAEDEREATRR